MLDVIMTAITAAFVAVLGYVAKQFAGFVLAKIELLRSDKSVSEKQVALIGLDLAREAIETVTAATVGKLEELYAKDLRVAIENGEMDRSSLTALAEQAYGEIVNTVRPELMNGLAESLQGVEGYVRSQIENQLLKLKAELYGKAEPKASVGAAHAE